MRKRCQRRLVVVVALIAASGCASWSSPPPVYGPAGSAPINPVLVPVMDRELVWEEVVDVVDDYFKIAHEERVRLVGDILTEGHLETYPCTGSTIFEPWKRDTVNRYERLESTLQSIRRRAAVRVIPAEGGFLVDVAVFKELEDVLRPESGAIDTAHSLRNDDSIRRKSIRPGSAPLTLGWIPLGRDTALEQDMLAHVQARLGAGPMVQPAGTFPGQLPPGGPVLMEPIPTPAPTPTVPLPAPPPARIPSSNY